MLLYRQTADIVLLCDFFIGIKLHDPFQNLCLPCSQSIVFPNILHCPQSGTLLMISGYDPRKDLIQMDSYGSQKNISSEYRFSASAKVSGTQIGSG